MQTDISLHYTFISVNINQIGLHQHYNLKDLEADENIKANNDLSLVWINPVGIALDYGLDNRGSRVRFSAGAGNFSLHHRIQNGSGAHPASYPMGTGDSGGKAAGAWSWPLTSI
jgi:hypothetical protein